ncbi:hypothetical protein [Polaromonas sp.]|jgi:hypothetical protein|uniref:hypothetical protein n=1 Tax=Polaromonas sp. TaxID=1869339 RepID=UPI0025FDF366|nr:hypothetical protein [Polaromonas sp.]
MKIAKLLFSIATCAALFGCAHPISMSPDLTSVAGESSTRINKPVGYHISDASRALEVTSAGGGGDKVSYFPYRDLDAGFYKALSEVFTNVTKVRDPKDSAAISASGIQLLITPEISTTSSSQSLFTWPPTQFSVMLNCTVVDAKGQNLTSIRVEGKGLAEFDEFKSNFSLAAVRASTDALKKLVKALAESKELRL